MRSIPAQIKSYAPGFALALVIALLAKGIEALLPFDVIGASVIAMFIGMLINGYRKPGKTTAPGVKFTAKKILKFAIILLGASLNVTTILNVGRMSLTVMLFTLLTCFGGGYFIGRALGLPERFLIKPPSDGLTGKTDEDNLGFSYHAVNEYVRKGVADPAIKEQIDHKHRVSRFKFQTIPVYHNGLPIVIEDGTDFYK